MSKSAHKAPLDDNRTFTISRYLFIGGLLWLSFWYFLIMGLDFSTAIQMLVYKYNNVGYEMNQQTANILLNTPFIIGSFALATGAGLVIKERLLRLIVIILAGIMFSYVSILIGVFLNLTVNY